MPKSVTSLSVTSLLSLFLILTVVLVFAKRFENDLDQNTYRASSFGQGDFIEYWSAYQVALSKKNPYDPSALLEVQQNLGRSQTEPLMMWNPPWTLLFLGPILQTNFVLSSRIWLLISFGLVLIISLILHQSFKSDRLGLLSAIAATVFFFPIWYSLQIGQLGVILALGAALLLYGYEKKNFPVIGLSLLLLSLKAHISYLVFVAVFHRALRERNAKPILYGLLFTGCLALLVELRFPGILNWWLTSLTAGPATSDFVAVERWKVATLTGIIRLQFAKAGFGSTHALMLLIPSLSAVILLAFLTLRKQAADWKDLLPPLFCISYLTSPFGWAFDQAILVVTQVSIVSMALSNERKIPYLGFSLCAALVGLSMFGEYYKTHLAVWHHELFFYPIPLLALWVMTYVSTGNMKKSN